MRHKFYFGFLLICFSLNANLFAQNFWVPDANFRNKLKQIYPTSFTAQDSLNTASFQIRYATTLNVSSSLISSLDGIQFFTYLSKLHCEYNQLTSIPSLPVYLTELYCFFNQLASLPALPGTLVTLACDYNELTSLQPLPLTLINLSCTNNLLTSLPTLPSNLKKLGCDNNQLTSLPSLPASLNDLFCQWNSLTSLPTLPPMLYFLYCRRNQLTSLPALPASLSDIVCDHNQLSSLPKIPQDFILLEFQNNPITCFPEIVPQSPGLSWIGVDIFMDSTLISCIPNQGIFPLSVIHNSQLLPFCSPFNTSCNYNFTNVQEFLDANGNGVKDSTEVGIALPVYFSGNSGVFPDSTGNFLAASDTGNITFQIAIPMYYLATTSPSQMIHVVNGIIDTIYFGMQPIPNIKDLSVDLSSIGFIRPGFDANYLLHYKNVGTDTIQNVRIKFLKPSQLVNVSTWPLANSLSGDTLIWDLSYLSPLQENSIIISDSVFLSATLGDTAMATAWIEPMIGDTTPVTNVSYCHEIIGGSFDPNDKSVSPKMILPNSVDILEYTIRFQNTGTDTAFTVTVLDTLSNLLEVYSMEMISASHSYQLSITNRIAKWIFSNILLPDSNTNELKSHGFLKFRIKPKPGLMLNDSIPNQAKIFFDYNSAVNTNTIVVNVNFVGVQELKIDELKIYPNPVQESLRIVNQHAGPLGKMELINANGKVLETKTISSSSYTWNLQHLPAGTYILKGLGWGQKVVKE